MSSKKIHNEYLSLGSRLRLFRKEKGLTQQELADAIGLSQNYLSRVETDQENLSKPIFLILQYLYRIKQEWLLTGEGLMYAADGDADRIAESQARYGDVRDKIMDMLGEMDEEGRQHIFDHVQATQRLLNHAKKKLKEG